MNRRLRHGAALGAAVVVALLGGTAAAHEVLHTVERGKAVALKAFFADGEALAYVPYEIYSPKDGKIPYQKGRTDRGGWVAFVPDAPGPWRVKVADDAGHGLDTVVDAGAQNDVPATSTARADGALGAAAFILRPVAGVVAVGLVFGALVLFYRRRGRGPS